MINKVSEETPHFCGVFFGCAVGMMRIIADKSIPDLDRYFRSHGELVKLDASDITVATLKAADVLLIRSVTPVNEALLKESSLKFVGSMSSGADHLATDAMDRAGITGYTAKGSNAIAVAEYVLCCIAYLQKQALLPEKPLIGIIGVGYVGEMLFRYLQALNIAVLLNDPPRSCHDETFNSVSLAEMLQCDLICLHVPLGMSGRYPTYHLMNEDFLKQCNPGTIILNASRGGIVDPAAIKAFRDKLIWCLDVWEHEPAIDIELLSIATLATPHIAGHTIEAKYRATEMVYHAFCQKFGLSLQGKQISLAEPAYDFLRLPHWQRRALSVYDPFEATQLFKQCIANLDIAFNQQQLSANQKNIAIVFNELRQQQGQRREF